ncbi:MAG: CRISPR-associated endonuclease Cas2 [Candidatus Staskawiczbacteria bacterium]|nr:CRISPR-associated endonuclease Cas2 [Candidatus Staskawiczbacteria bacterium]
MIAFDIPQKHRKARELLRSILENLGYKMFQQSVWVTSYDVSEKTERLLQAYSLDNYVKIFLVEKL